MSQAKNWVFTLNNPTLDQESELQVTREEITYIVYGHETGEQGTHHLQGYVEFKKKMSMKQIKELFGFSMHLEVRKGTAAQADEYARKDGTNIYSRGTISKVGRPTTTQHKNKLLPFIPDIKKSLATFADHPEASFHLLKHAKEYLAINESPRKRNEEITVRWFWGPTGSGKTRKAFDMAEKRGLEPYIKSGNYKWFDGYDGHEFVIFDDFRDAHCEFAWLLKLLDRYPIRVEIKGGTRQWKPKEIIVTSPMPPDECYANMQSKDKYDKIGQLLRRINEIEHITKYEPEEQDPQTPQGGLNKGINISPGQLITPPRFHYPVEIGTPLPPHPRPIPVLADYLFPDQDHSPTQIWNHPPHQDSE